MAKKTIGHIELQWTCPNCGGKNPGSVQVCNNCGAPQPIGVEFEQPKHQELIVSKEGEARAEASADIHCPYCGTRNPGTAKVCSHCGGDLVDGEKRVSGRVVGAFKTSPVATVLCPNCSTKNPDTAKTCSNCGAFLDIPGNEPQEKVNPPISPKTKTRKGIPIALIALVLIICGALAVFTILSLRTEAVTGTVQSVSWQRSIPIEALVPVDYQDWQDEIPTGAEVGTCDEKLRYIQDEPVTNSVEVCGTPYNVDTGNGYAEVVQDCEYQVYDQYCTYSQDEWREVNSAVLTGNDYIPTWPNPSLTEGQRIGEGRQEIYKITFNSGNQNYIYQTSDFELYQKCQVGSSWHLNINSFGAVVSIEP